MLHRDCQRLGAIWRDAVADDREALLLLGEMHLQFGVQPEDGAPKRNALGGGEWTGIELSTDAADLFDVASDLGMLPLHRAHEVPALEKPPEFWVEGVFGRLHVRAEDVAEKGEDLVDAHSKLLDGREPDKIAHGRHLVDVAMSRSWCSPVTLGSACMAPVISLTETGTARPSGVM